MARRWFSECTCSPKLNWAGRPVQPLPRCAGRLSGPLLDRINITDGVVSRHVEVPRVPFQKLSSIASTTSGTVGGQLAANDWRPTIGGEPGARRGGAGAAIGAVPTRRMARGQPDHQCGYGSDPGPRPLPGGRAGRYTEGARHGHAAAAGQAMNLNARACHRVLNAGADEYGFGRERAYPAGAHRDVDLGSTANHLRLAAAEGISG